MPEDQAPTPSEPVNVRRRHPARLTGICGRDLSRWLWLVKWILIVPHYVVLLFLNAALCVVTVIAFFAILFTGRYPRPLFDFSVGVLRWDWRVAFYSYSALATDAYPPFRFSAGGYPADFEVDYPEHLSRGLVLVKSWLLALPHLMVVSLMTGTGWTVTSTRAPDYETVTRVGGSSLLTLLAIIAGVLLLFNGKYPEGLFALVMGINRWIYRVLSYVALLRDEYPPLRLEQGGTDPGQGLVLDGG